MVVVLAVQVLTHNLDVRLLAHLLGGLHSKTDVAYFLGNIRLPELLLHHGDSCRGAPPPRDLGSWIRETTLFAPLGVAS